MPNALIFDYFPYLRVYARFVAPAMCVVLAMAAVGLWLLMRNRSITARLSVLSVVAILSFVDLAPTVPLGSAQPIPVEGRAPQDVPTWVWLKTHDPGQIVYETPGYPDELLERYYAYGQIVHDHPITNGTIVAGQLSTDFQLETADPRYPGTAARLASVGIPLVTSEPWGWRFMGLKPENARVPPPGLRAREVLPRRERDLAGHGAGRTPPSPCGATTGGGRRSSSAARSGAGWTTTPGRRSWRGAPAPTG